MKEGILSILRRTCTSAKYLVDRPADEIAEAAKAVLGTQAGEVLFNHLIIKTKIDQPGAAMSERKANYSNGSQDIVKYVLALASKQ